MIPVEIKYKTHNDEPLAIIEAFKTWHHHLKSYKHNILVLTYYNNLQ